MTKEKLMIELIKLLEVPNKDKAHFEADILLLKFIDDVDITLAYTELLRWYKDG